VSLLLPCVSLRFKTFRLINQGGDRYSTRRQIDSDVATLHPAPTRRQIYYTPAKKIKGMHLLILIFNRIYHIIMKWLKVSIIDFCRKFASYRYVYYISLQNSSFGLWHRVVCNIQILADTGWTIKLCHVCSLLATGSVGGSVMPGHPRENGLDRPLLLWFMSRSIHIFGAIFLWISRIFDIFLVNSWVWFIFAQVASK